MTQTAVVYTAQVETIGGRENGLSRSSDGLLDIRLSTPRSARIGTNPEQLFAAGWSASLASAIALAAKSREIVLQREVRIAAEVDLNFGDGGYFLGARFTVKLPGLELDIGRALLDEAQQNCPYCRAAGGNVRVLAELA
jgi:lipoyl-dependent peroxiredoxin